MPEEFAEHPHHVRHQVDRVVPHHHLPCPVDLVGLGGVGKIDLVRGDGHRRLVGSRPDRRAAGSSPVGSTRVTTNVDTPMYSQMSATDSQSLARSTRMRSTEEGYRARLAMGRGPPPVARYPTPDARRPPDPWRGVPPRREARDGKRETGNGKRETGGLPLKLPLQCLLTSSDD